MQKCLGQESSTALEKTRHLVRIVTEFKRRSERTLATRITVGFAKSISCNNKKMALLLILLAALPVFSVVAAEGDSVPCPLISCPVCPDGYHTEKPVAKHGCDVSCKCVPDVPRKPCPMINCPQGRFGKCRKVDGCDICECLPPCPPLRPCPRTCSLKFKNSCPYCHCDRPVIKARPCTLAMCLMFCENGFQKDKNGCQICKCKDDPPAEPVCPLNMCKMFCRNGFEKDENGCTLCKCKPQECKPVRCRMYCKHGFKKDANGCEICKCNRPACPLMMCRMYCKHGYQTNEKGCRICKCNPAIPMEIRAVKIGAPGSRGKK